MSVLNSDDKQPIEVASENWPARETFVDIADTALEKRVVRKLDLNILPLTMVMHLGSFLDRSNLGNAKVNGLVSDLNLKGADFNGRTYSPPSATCPYPRP